MSKKAPKKVGKWVKTKETPQEIIYKQPEWKGWTPGYNLIKVFKGRYPVAWYFQPPAGYSAYEKQLDTRKEAIEYAVDWMERHQEQP